MAEQEYGRHKDDKNREEVYMELNKFYQDKEKEVEEVQNLLIREIEGTSSSKKSGSTPQMNQEKSKSKNQSKKQRKDKSRRRNQQLNMVENLDEEKKVTDSDSDSDAGRKLNEELDLNELSDDDEIYKNES